MNAAKEDNYKINEKITLRENIADISGFQITEQTYINELIISIK